MYNRRELAIRAIDSVLNQTVRDFNLYVIENGSDLLRDFSPDDTRYHYIHVPEKTGPARARNLGAAAGNSPWLAFLDSDDAWLPEKFQKSLEFIAKHPEFHWLHTNELWMRHDRVVRQRRWHRKTGGAMPVSALERCLVSPSSVMIRRSLFTASGGFAESFFLAEDFEFWLRIWPDNPVGFLEQPLTIKYAGDWPQLSADREMDRYRVLALHRLWRKIRRSPESPPEELLAILERKSNWLQEGALRHGNVRRLKRYQSWSVAFRMLRMRAIRAAEDGTDRKS